LYPARNKGKDQLESLFEGPMAIVFIKEDISKAAKTLTDHIAASKLVLAIKGGFMGTKLLNAKEIATIATLPSREVLLAKLMSSVQGRYMPF
jgi:large subunit ribosomal protein L10